MSWISAAAAAASSFVAETASKVQQTIEHERSEFASEYSRCLHSIEAPPTNKASVSSSSRSPAPSDTKAQLRATLNQAKSLGAALFNPFEDQDSLTKAANERPERVIMLPWEQPGITDAMRVKMRSLSQERATFLAPPVKGSSSYVFELSSNLGLVIEALKIDAHLERQRHLLVPDQISEELFFQNYFHHLHVIADGGRHREHIVPVDGTSVSSPSPVLVTNSEKASSEGTDVPSFTPLEETFECISENSAQECLASEVALRFVDGSQAGRKASAGDTLAISDDRDAAASWEAELRAELDSM